MTNSFEGILTPTLTPFTESGALYERGFENLFSFLSENGVNGVFVGGSYAAFPLLSEEERMRVTAISVSLAKKYKLQCVAHIGHASTQLAVKLAKYAEGLGADAVACVLPYYYSGHAYTDENYFMHFDAILNSVRCPVHIYNNPRTTKVAVTPNFLRSLQEMGVSGMKDSGSDMKAFREYAAAVWSTDDKSFDLMPGSGSVLFEGFQMGARACVAGTSVVFPDEVSKLHRLLSFGDEEGARQAQVRVNQARDVQQSMNMRPASAYSLLRARGIDVGAPRLPWRPLNESELEIAVEKLRALSISVEAG
jgi:dihydrodipicolinate synthase/N-acetylneuraminate lyase